MCAVRASNVTHPAGPTLFRTYDVPENNNYNCTIWEAARATLTVPTLFKPINIGPRSSKIAYVGGGLGYNNPVKQVVAEAGLVFGENAQIACIVSIEPGSLGDIVFTKPNALERLLLPGLIPALETIAMDSEKTANEMEKGYRHRPGVYHRLAVYKEPPSLSRSGRKLLYDLRDYT